MSSPYNFLPEKYEKELLQLINSFELVTLAKLHKNYLTLVKKFPRKDGRLFTKDQIIQGIRFFVEQKKISKSTLQLIEVLQKKPTRTISGVTPVTVLTKPFPCPGKCIFCPNDIRMPKSYLHDEPGAQRAERNQFDPYLQTMSRLKAFQNIGHITQKVEIIVLGGTWSFYPESYQIWFIKRCFDALNDFGSGVDHRLAVEENYLRKSELKNNNSKNNTEDDPSSLKLRRTDLAEIDGEKITKTYNQVISELFVAPEKLLKLDDDQNASWEELHAVQRLNEFSACRNVGLVIETRPDNISEAEVIRIRKLGCTKTQIGFQSLQDDVLSKNKRGHDVEATRRAVRLLRQAGFKIHAHWMPNLYGSSPQKDIEDYDKMFSDDDFKPDELKVYPCSLIQSAELMQYFKKGLWKPYTHQELLHVLVECFKLTPEYCRLTRVIRDIPSTDIVEGNKLTNFREVVQKELEAKKIVIRDIRSREVRGDKIDDAALQLDEVTYSTSVSTEIFLQFVTVEDLTSPEQSRKIAGFLRLSLPKKNGFIDELAGSAMIREVHVYGQSSRLGENELGKAQHKGLGKRLIARAIEIATEKKYKKLQVISAVGTREYYRKLEFEDGELYQYRELNG